MDSVPTFSVVIPAYNYGHFLPEAIESILDQQRTDVQIVLVDDASEDETTEICKRYADKLEYIRNVENLGAGGAWCVGLERAKGRYIIKLDADDQMVPDCLNRVQRAFEADDTVGIVISSVWVLHQDTNRMILKTVTDVDTTLSSENFRRKLLGGFFFKMPGCAIRGELINRIGPPDPELYQIHDWEFILRSTNGYKAALLSAPAAIYRVHDKSITSTAQTADRLSQDIKKWLFAASQPGDRHLSTNELDRLRGSCAELMLTGFIPKPNLKSCTKYAQNYGKALKLSLSGGIGQMLRMHWSLFLKLLNILRTPSQDRPVVRQL